MIEIFEILLGLGDKFAAHIVLSASALSYESPTLPTEGSMPASANRSV